MYNVHIHAACDLYILVTVNEVMKDSFFYRITIVDAIASSYISGGLFFSSSFYSFIGESRTKLGGLSFVTLRDGIKPSVAFVEFRCVRRLNNVGDCILYLGKTGVSKKIAMLRRNLFVFLQHLRV